MREGRSAGMVGEIQRLIARGEDALDRDDVVEARKRILDAERLPSAGNRRRARRHVHGGVDGGQ